MKKKFLLMAMALLAMTASAQTETDTEVKADRITIDDVFVVRGSQATATVNYGFGNDYYGFQLETTMPNFTVGKRTISDELDELGFAVSYQRLSSGVDRFIGVNYDYAPIPQGSGKIFDFIIRCPSTTLTGVYPTTFNYVEFTNSEGQREVLDEVTFNIIVVDPDDSYIPIDEDHFPDPEFREWIIKNIPNGPDDSNGGRLIPTSVIKTITVIDVHDCGIHDISGIEYFPYLEELYIYNNHLSGIDTSGNGRLRILHGWGNGMMGYDGSGNGNLTDVRMSKQTIHAPIYNRGGKWGFHTTEWGFDLGRVGGLTINGNGVSGGSGGFGFLGGADGATGPGNCGCWWWFDWNVIPTGMTYIYYINGGGSGTSGGGTMEVEIIFEPVIRTVDITPGENDLDDYHDEVVDVTLDGFTFNPDRWITFCVPFDATLEQMQETFGENVDIEELVSSTWDAPNLFLMLYFTPRNAIVAGMPYVLKVDATVTNPRFNGVKIKDVTPTTITTTYCSMTGVFSATPLTANDKNTLFISNNHFYYPTTNEPLPATKCYFSLIGDAQQANSMALSFDEADGIMEIFDEKATVDGGWYTLQGVRVSTPQKGVYIHNGKKVTVK